MGRRSIDSERKKKKKKKKSTDEYSGKAVKPAAPLPSDSTRQMPLDSTVNPSRDSSTSNQIANKKRDDSSVSTDNSDKSAKVRTPVPTDNTVRDLNNTIAGAVTNTTQSLPSASRANFTHTYVMKATEKQLCYYSRRSRHRIL